MEKAIIVDIDGTVANAGHRLHLLPRPNEDGSWPKEGSWDEFYGVAHLDAVNDDIERLVYGLSLQGHPILFATGRSEDQRELTEAWLKANIRAPYQKLYMRKAGDWRVDDVVKCELLAQMRDDGYDPVMAIEDRSRVVAMWRAQGLRCIQVCEGDY